MRYLFTAIIIAANSIVTAADVNGVLEGRVVDSKTYDPLAGVYVIYGKDLGEITDGNGRFMISTEADKLTVTFKFLGYETLTREFFLTSGDTIETEILLDMVIKEIDQVVVTANRTEQRMAELTVSMDIVKNSFLTQNHIIDAQEIVNKTPGIEVMDGQASVRGGSGFSYGAGSRVLALIDGLPVSSADAGNIKWQFLPLENISQIEIIKGASSVLYGSSALNGIINFRTADATVTPDTRFFVETGIFGKPRNENWIWWRTPRTFSTVSFSHLRRMGNNDFGIGLNLMNDEGYRRLNGEQLGRLNLKFKHRSARNERLTYGINIHSGVDNKTDFVQWEDADSGALKQSPSSAVEVRQKFLAADPYISLNKTGTSKHDLRMRLQMSENRFPVSTQNNSTAWSLFSEYQGWFRLSDVFDLTAGASETYSIVNSEFYGDHTGINLAGYSQLEAKPLEKLKAVAGVRIEHNTLDGIKDRFVPIFRAGLNWEAARNTFFRASLGQGYRYPSIAEKYAATTLGSVRIIPNPEIVPEYGWSSEIGVKHGIETGKLTGQADISVFILNNKDLIEFIYAIYPEVGDAFKAINVEQSRVYGYEAELILNRTFGKIRTTLSGGYTYIYPAEINSLTRENTGIYLKYRRKHSGKISLTTSRDKIDFGLSFYIKSRILNIDDVFLNPGTREVILPGFYDYWLSNNKAYFVADVNLGYKINDKYTLSFIVKNITNTEYMGRPGDIQPHRNFGLRFSGNL